MQLADVSVSEKPSEAEIKRLVPVQPASGFRHIDPAAAVKVKRMNSDFAFTDQMPHDIHGFYACV